MLNRRTALVAALGVLLGALPATARAQEGSGWFAGRPSIETSYTQLRLDSDGPAMNAGSFGGRLMWSPTPLVGAAPSLAGRTALGLYGMYAPERTFGPVLKFSTFGFGAVADVRPLSAPLGGRVDPFLSLGTGLLHTAVDVSVSPSPSPLVASSRTAFTLTPGLGLRVLLTPGLALQGDVRDLVTFRGDTRHNLGLGAGLRFGF